MPVAITRTIQIGAILVGIAAFILMFGYLQNDLEGAREAGTAFGTCVVIVLLATIIRLITDIGERLLEPRSVLPSESKSQVAGQLPTATHRSTCSNEFAVAYSISRLAAGSFRAGGLR